MPRKDIPRIRSCRRSAGDGMAKQSARFAENGNQRSNLLQVEKAVCGDGDCRTGGTAAIAGRE